MSHFFVPRDVGFYVWYWRRGVGFNALMWTYITVSFMAAVVYVLLPAAPPWMAGRAGLIPPVVDVIKDGLQIIGFDTAGPAQGRHQRAVPDRGRRSRRSMPRSRMIGVLVARRYRMPRWAQTVLIAHLCVIWFTIVYTGEHYVIDIAGGVVFALIALVDRADRGRPGSSPRAAPVEVPAWGRPRRPPAQARQAGLRGDHTIALRGRGYTDGVPEKTYLITPGPTPVPPEVQAAMARPLIHHRSPDFKRLFAETLAGLKRSS